MSSKRPNGYGDAVEVNAWQTEAEAAVAYANAVEIAELERLTRTPDGKLRPEPGTKLFDITCVIGSVYADMGGDHLSPRQAAFLIIADYTANGTGGEFHFPSDLHGGETIVAVEPEPEPKGDVAQ